MGIKINSYTETGTSYVIPTTRDNVRVTDIGQSCFANKYIANIKGDSILNIGGNAFAGCIKLTSVSFPSCSYIGSYAFWLCYSLTSVSFPNCSYISAAAFRGCSSLAAVSFPVCSYINGSAFCNTSLSDWNGIENSWFRQEQGCLFEKSTNKLIAYAPKTSYININISDCSYINGSAFYEGSRLTAISFPQCSYIGSAAFSGCSSLAAVSFPVCSYIGGGAFYSTAWLSNQFSNSSIAKLTTNYQQFLIQASATQISGSIVDTSTTFICSWALRNCSNLTAVAFQQCSYIGEAAFYQCSKLTTISFPNCSYIGGAAFCYCNNLTTAYFMSTSVPTLVNSGAFIGCTSLISIYVPTSLVGAYKSATNWSLYSDKIVGM